MRKYLVKLGIRTVFSGSNEYAACCAYDEAVKKCQSDNVEYSGKKVTLLLNNNVLREFISQD